MGTQLSKGNFQILGVIMPCPVLTSANHFTHLPSSSLYNSGITVLIKNVHINYYIEIY